MAYNEKGIITDKDIKPVPQYYNPTADKYEPIHGRDGANSFLELGHTVKEVWNGTGSMTKSFSSKRYGFGLVNDGNNDLTVTINNISILVKPGETFEDLFEGFTQLDISGSSSFRAIARA